MTISYYFRKPSETQHSIEVQFDTIQNKLPSDFTYINHYSKYFSKNLYKIIFNIFEGISKQSMVNHITGDIHYISLLLKKRKTILTIHDIASSITHNKLKSYFIKLLWFTLAVKKVRYITVISEFTKNQLLEYINIKAEKVFVIPDCISDNFKYSPKEFSKNKAIILQIGTKENKNLTNLIESLKDLNCKLLIIGKLTVNQIELLEKNKINYENTYNLTHSEIISYYKKADILTFVSTYEGFGVPIIEANAIGRPVITSNISPMKEIAGDAAILVDPYCTKDIKNAVLKLINDMSLRKSLIEKGLENAKKYKAEHIAQQYCELYKKILNK